MRGKLVLVSALTVVLSVLMLSTFANSRLEFYSFSISLPNEVTANPGETMNVEGGITVTGMYWLHNFDISIEGLNYNYTVNPQHMQEVPILREWNPQDGVYRVPVKFNITINVPQSASGIQIVTVAGQEHQSFRQVANSTFFVLRIGGAPSQGNQSQRTLDVTDILAPEQVQEGAAFNITFRLNNRGNEKTASAISIIAPQDWQVDAKTKYFNVDVNSSVTGTFTLTPTASAGTVSLLLEYPYQQEIVNYTRTGPYFQPVISTTSTSGNATQPKPFITAFYEWISNGLNGIWNGIKNLSGGTLTDNTLVAITIGIIGVLVLVIIWLVWGIAKDLRGASKKPEKIEKKAEVSSSVCNINDDAFSGVDRL